MKVIVISDSHGSKRNIDYALQTHPDAKHVFFLGDTIRDIEAVKEFYKDRIFHIVKGNCDFSDNEKSADEIILGGKRIFYTHGHNFYVKSGCSALLERAQTVGADIALYGHTHIPKIEYINGIYLINPGSIGHSRETNNSYCIIDIKDTGILPSIVKI